MGNRFLKLMISNPLSLMRILLSILVGKYIFKTCKNITFGIPNHNPYELSHTWITSLFPERMLEFYPEDFIYWKIILIIVTVCSALGILGRLNLFFLSLLTMILYGVDEGIGSFDHQLSFSAQVLFILALVPGSMRLSFDMLIIKLFRKKEYLKIFNAPPKKWGLNLILLLLVATYLTAGISKLRFGGLEYFDGETIGFYIQERTFEFDKGSHKLIIGDGNLTSEDKWKDNFGLQAYAYSNITSSERIKDVQIFIASSPNILKIITLGSIVFEFLGFIVFFGSKYRNIYLCFAFMFHTVIGLLMGFTFYQYRLICILLFDWKSILNYFNYRFPNVFSNCYNESVV